jgi:hypothetical protein
MTRIADLARSMSDRERPIECSRLRIRKYAVCRVPMTAMVKNLRDSVNVQFPRDHLAGEIIWLPLCGRLLQKR